MSIENQPTNISHICPKCGIEKPLTTEFFTQRVGKTGIFFNKYSCRKCLLSSYRETSRRCMQRRRSTKEGKMACRESVKKWKLLNPDKVMAQRKKMAEKNGYEYISLSGYKQRQIERYYDRIIEQNARDAFDWWFAKKTDEQVREWYESVGKPWLNPRLTDAEAWRIKYRLCPEFTIHERMRRQLKKSITKDGIGDLIRSTLKRGGESVRVRELLGYTINQLKVHLERQFKKGMTWNKFMKGELHIDHIIPKSSFDLTDPNQWRACWDLPNLRPLWASDNLSKSNKVLTLC